MNPNISVIIPTFNEERYIGKLLERLKAQTYQSFEVIIADNNSKDRTRDIVRSYGYTVVKGGNLSSGRNNGAKTAKSNILVFIDADSYPESDEFLEHIAMLMQIDAFDAASCFFKPKEKHVYTKLFCFFANFVKRMNMRFFSRERIFGEYGGCMIVKRHVFNSVKGLNETIPAQEDSEFFQRIVRAGFRYDVSEQYIVVSGRRFINKSFIDVVSISFHTVYLLIYKFIFKQFPKNMLYAYAEKKGQLGGRVK